MKWQWPEIKQFQLFHLQPFHLWWLWCHSLLAMKGWQEHHQAQRLSSSMPWSSLEGARHLFVADRPAWKSQKKKLLSAAASKANNRMLALAPSAPGAQLGSQSPTAWQKLRAASCFHLTLRAPDRDVTKPQQRQEATVPSALLRIRKQGGSFLTRAAGHWTFPSTTIAHEGNGFGMQGKIQGISAPGNLFAQCNGIRLIQPHRGVRPAHMELSVERQEVLGLVLTNFRKYPD